VYSWYIECVRVTFVDVVAVQSRRLSATAAGFQELTYSSCSDEPGSV
jgi:hypothetical protein